MLVKEGYTLSELLLCLMMLSSAMVLLLSSVPVIEREDIDLLTEYVKKQSLALAKQETIYLQAPYQDIHFNGRGNVNQGRTLLFTNHQVIIYLGNGTFRHD